MIEKDLVVIGGGPAGLTAGIYAKRAELDLVVLDSGIGGGQIANAGTVENYPGFPDGIRGLELAESFKKHAENTGVDLKVLEVVESIEKDESFYIVATDKSTYKARAVIVASGLVYKKLGVPGEDELAGRGVSYCATCDGAFFKGKKVAVVGSGTGAAMAALNLSDLAAMIYVVSGRKALRIGERIIETRLKKAANIKSLSETSVKEIIGKGRVEGLTLVKNGKESKLTVDGVFVEVGRTPKTDFMSGLDLDLKRGYIVVNSRQESSLPGLFAAGDVVLGSYKQVGVAVAQGSIAALAAYDYIKNNF